MSLTELIIDTLEPEENAEAMYIKPSRFNTTKYLSPNTFDQATIKHSTVEQITSNGLSGIYSSLKPLGKIYIIVHQPISVMVFYDSKQIEANLKLAGFENIKISDIKYDDEISKHEIQTQEIEAEKPESKRNPEIDIEIKKTIVKEHTEYKPDYKPYKPVQEHKVITTKTTTNTNTSTTNTGYKVNTEHRMSAGYKINPEHKINTEYKVSTEKREPKEQKPVENNKFYSIKVTKNTSTNNNTYKPKVNNTYVKKEIKEEIVEEKKEEITDNKPKNRTYIREQKEEQVENNTYGGRKSYFKRRFRGTSDN